MSTSISFGQQNPMTSEKGQRTLTPVNTDDLNAIIITPQQENANFPTLNYLPNITAKNELPNLEIFYDDKNGMPIMLKGMVGTQSIQLGNESSIQDAALEYLNAIKIALRIDDPSNEFEVVKIQTDALGMTHIRMQQVFMGIKVEGGELILHTDLNNKIVMAAGRFYPTPNMDNVLPLLNADASEAAAMNEVKNETVVKALTAKEKTILQSSETEAELVIFHKDNDLHSEQLAWHVTVRPNFMERWEYHINAKTGENLSHYNHTCALDGPATATAVDLAGISRTIDVYDVGGTYFMIDATQSMFNLGASTMPDDPRGAIWTIDANNTSPQNNMNVSHVSSSNNSWNNPTAVSGHYNAKESYDYFKNTHSRNSINGNGGRVVSIINVSDENNNSMDNAFWNGAAIFYGNGGTAFQPLAKSLDVAGHEMSHGVVSNSANLQYQGESGALNESFADIFGTMIDRDDWNLGDDIVNTQYFPSGALRSMSDPHNGGSSLNDNGYQPRHTNEQYTGSQDNGGVHINSGIANWAYYKYATAIGKDKAEDTYYRALTMYLTSNSQFVDARVGVIQAAEDLYGVGSSEATAAGTAFDAVGIAAPTGGGGGGGGSNPGTGVGVIQPGDLPAVIGTDYILSHDTDAFNSNTLYISTPQATNFTPISTTTLRNPPSITDEGDYAVYIGNDDRMRGITLDGVSSEGIISNNAIWSNVAISKDGNRIAAITTSQDTAIWVYDFNLAQWAKFPLFNPSFTQGVSSGDVLYADAIEWDYTGEYIVYDALNRINGLSGQAIEYWDVGVLKAWDNTANGFGDGSISKVFSNLPEDISIGNPSFSKNSPYILAFDYIDQANNAYSLIAVNLVTGANETVFQNSRLSYPSYSRLDDKLIFNASNSGSDVTGVIDLMADKVTPNGTATVLIQDAKWARWYTKGQRGTSSSSQIKTLEGVSMYPNPVSEVLTITIENATKDGSIAIFNAIGQEVQNIQLNKRGRVQEQLNMEKLPIGIYLVKVKIGEEETTHKVVKAE